MARSRAERGHIGREAWGLKEKERKEGGRKDGREKWREGRKEGREERMREGGSQDGRREGREGKKRMKEEREEGGWRGERANRISYRVMLTEFPRDERTDVLLG